MKSILFKGFTALFAVAILAVSCKKEDKPTTPPTPTDPYEHLYKIGTLPASGSGLTITLYMDEEPFMGYNYVYAVVTDDVTDQVVENAMVTFNPMMDMGNHSHSSPFEDPSWSPADKATKGTITFIMPSAMGTWTVEVEVQHPTTMDKGSAVFDVNVINKPEPKLFSFVSQTGSNKKVFVALTDPRDPSVGMNDFNLVIYQKSSMMSFPPMSDLIIEIEPEMPTMGHGSPNNVHPTPTDNGHYEGEVNFTMTGYWKVNMVIKNSQGQVMHDQGYFDITFQ